MGLVATETPAIVRAICTSGPVPANRSVDDGVCCKAESYYTSEALTRLARQLSPNAQPMQFLMKRVY